MYNNCDWYEDRLECHDWDTDGFPGEFIHGDNVYIDDYHMGERWKRNDRAPDYWVSNKDHVWSEISDGFISGNVNADGYTDFTLKGPNGERCRDYLHEMMGRAFIPNPNNLPFVLHYDDDKSNNTLENLRWGTPADNTEDCIRNGHLYRFSDEDHEKAMEKRRMPITAVKIRTGEAFDFESQQEAARQLGIDQSSINDILYGRAPHTRGWYFVEQGEEIPDLSHIDLRRHAKNPPIRAINLETGEELEFRGLTRAAEYLDMSIASISNVLRGKQRTAKGWVFEYIDEEMW